MARLIFVGPRHTPDRDRIKNGRKKLVMPASVAHMLISNKAVKVLQEGGRYPQFIDIFNSKIYKPYLNLG
jgi:hypothetical protein